MLYVFIFFVLQSLHNRGGPFTYQQLAGSEFLPAS